jgi:hypothetical protein
MNTAVKKEPTVRPRTPGAKRFALFAAMLAVSGVIALILAEIALRLFPIPGIIFHNFYYDPVTGGKYYPNSTVTFRGDDGVLIRRSVNSWGFVDVGHKVAKAPGTLRIGFFGDSYVEALQVPIEATFFRLVEDDLDLRTSELARLKTHDGKTINAVETLAFGMSGRGALQSYLECTNWMQKLDLDYVVYVFVENDPADQIRQLKGPGLIPYPIAAGDSFTVDDSEIRAQAYKASWWHRGMQRIKSNSLVVSTIEGRLKLLKSYGAKRTVTEADRNGAAGAVGFAPMAPSAWPPELVPKGWDLQTRVLDKWSREVIHDKRKFVVLHVPRGEEVLRVPFAEQDTWATRLEAYCATRHIPLVEPTALFVKREDAGQKMYHNHFTPDGHRAFAEAFVDYLLKSASR